GAARILLRAADGSLAAGAPFRVVAGGGAFAEILRPAEDPAMLGATNAWLEVRAGAAAGLRALMWETGDGRRGRLGGALGGARDTTIAAVAPLAAGRAPGETVRFRVVAQGRSGAPAASGWRRGIVADAATLRAGTAVEREAAASGMARAVSAAREAAAAGGEATGGSPEPPAAIDRELRAAADSLARALDRTLADPALGPRLAERLEGLRQTLRGAAEAELEPRPGLPADPAAAALARAAVLDAVRSRLAAAETALARTAAADTLEQLAGAESALAERTQATRPEALERAIGPRQAQIEAASRQTAAALGDSVVAGLDVALDRARAEVAAGDPAAAAEAQDRAADALQAAAASARQQAEAAATGSDAGTREAMERAGAETLFLAERQRALAGRLARVAGEGGTHRDRLARQEVVTGGLERALGTLVEGIGGRPAGVALARRLARTVFATQYAE
ncbi:MAG: hypothetical protein LC708_03250, partial [Actinobacteria bacterium]|nr:hypothetical protein [Actinomycetota bacterium]